MHRPRIGVLALMLAATLVACDVHEPVSIPPGATEVHIELDAERVGLTPASVPPGEVYLVLEGPGQGWELVSRGSAATEKRSPLDAAQVERVRAGDLQSTTIELFQVTCAPDDWTAQVTVSQARAERPIAPMAATAIRMRMIMGGAVARREPRGT